ncbi:MAG: TonB-dependent receptor [Rikenellaceae bacterium]|nr:TonB-dependent receptor [Rikenellaceae bacterium]
MDVTVLNGRIDLVVDWYNTKTTGVIWNRPLPVVFGSYASGTQYVSAMNLAATENRGWEVALNTVNIRSREVNWTSTLTYSTNKQKITKLFGGDSDFLDTGDGYVFKVGEAVRSYYG